MALDDLFQVTHKFAAFGKNMHNVYHAERSSGIEISQAIADAFVNSIFPKVQLLWPPSYTSVEVVVFNLGDPTDFHTQTLPSGGLRAGTANEPSFVAGGVRFPTRNRLVHSGQKRFPGLLDADIVDGVIIAGTVTLLEDIADALLANWLASSDSHNVASFVIIQRVCDVTDPVTGKCLQYRLPEPPEIPVFYLPNARVVNSDATSQVSRKM